MSSRRSIASISAGGYRGLLRILRILMFVAVGFWYIHWTNYTASADGFISFIIGAFFLYVTFINVLSRTIPERIPASEVFTRLININIHYERYRLSNITMKVYDLRWVWLFVLLALFIAAIAPVSAIMEIEENITYRSCTALINDGTIAPHVRVQDCVNRASPNSLASDDGLISGLKGHFIQITLWPLMLFTASSLFNAYIWLQMKNRGVDLRTALATTSDAFTFFPFGISLLSFGLSTIQNALAT